MIITKFDYGFFFSSFIEIKIFCHKIVQKYFENQHFFVFNEIFCTLVHNLIIPEILNQNCLTPYMTKFSTELLDIVI